MRQINLMGLIVCRCVALSVMIWLLYWNSAIILIVHFFWLYISFDCTLLHIFYSCVSPDSSGTVTITEAPSKKVREEDAAATLAGMAPNSNVVMTDDGIMTNNPLLQAGAPPDKVYGGCIYTQPKPRFFEPASSENPLRIDGQGRLTTQCVGFSFYQWDTVGLFKSDESLVGCISFGVYVCVFIIEVTFFTSTVLPHVTPSLPYA